jgi:hypothetical protein
MPISTARLEPAAIDALCNAAVLRVTLADGLSRRQSA